MADEKNPPPEAVVPDPSEGPGKGKAFFDRARSVAVTGNFDYAIDMYLEGLHREPFNLEEHKALREVAMRRKIAGGKTRGGLLGLGASKQKYKGKTPKEGLLNNEFILARDVGNITAMMAMIRNADILNLKDLVLWLGAMLKEGNKTNKNPKVEIYTELGEIYAKHKEFEKACDVINEACLLKPNDSDLSSLSQHYAAQATIERGKYGDGESFQGSIKDADATKKLLQEENLSKSDEYRLQAMMEARTDYEKNPKELQVINKYAKTLVEMDDEAHENMAIEMLKSAYADTKIYRLKALIGDIRIKQYRRNLRLLHDAAKADPADKELIRQCQELDKERLAYELTEYKERAEYMPTDLVVKYELGMRHYHSKHFDEAIPALQEAQNNPKVRVEALHFLGRAFLQQNMKPEAVETLKRSIEEYDLRETGNKKSKELHYWYARALEENKQAAEAIDIYSKIVRWDIGFLDSRKRMTDLRAQTGQN